MGALSTIPKAKQARSPIDRPKKRVWATRLPAIFACSSVKGIASRMGLSVFSHASSGLTPSLTSLVCTSARLTVLLVAMLNSSGGSLSAPGSWLSNASNTEESSTILLTLGGLAAFRNEFVNQRPAGFYISPDTLLGSLKTAFQGCNPQFVVFDPQNDFVPDIDAERLAKRRGNHDAAVLIHAHSGFGIHCHTLLTVTLLYYMSLALVVTISSVLSIFWESSSSRTKRASRFGVVSGAARPVAG